MDDERFVEVICEMLDIPSPADIRHDELVKLLREHFGDDDESHYAETHAGILYREVYDDPNSEE